MSDPTVSDGTHEVDIRGAEAMTLAPDAPPSSASIEGDGADQARADIAATFAATLVDEWARLGLTDVMISPGSRSTPMALAFHRDDRIEVHVHQDERSASFMALGAALSSRRPVAMLCTSGTAATEFHSAVVEAGLANVPLLVLTADRPPELRHVGAPQTIEQIDLYGVAVRWFHDAEVPRGAGRNEWRDLARRAWSNATGVRPGPIHLNLPFREPLVGHPGELPECATQASSGGLDALLPGEVLLGSQDGLHEADLVEFGAAISGRRGVIVTGPRAAQSRQDVAAVHLLAEQLGWPVFADGISGCRIEVLGCVTAFDSLLRSDEFAASRRPEVVIRIGGLLASKALNRWIATSGAKLIGFDSSGHLADPDRVFKEQRVVSTAVACEQLRSVVEPCVDPGWRQSWIDAERVALEAIDRVLGSHPEATEPGVVVDLFALLNDEGTVVLSSSMPVRDAEWFAPGRNTLSVIANRGANGIDGVVSTAVGAALDGAPTALLIGDLAFLHDSNALIGLRNRNLNLLIVVLDNNGGGIFSMLPVSEQVDSGTFESLFGTPHDVDLVKLCEAHGIPAERVSSRTGAQAAMVGGLSRGGARVVVVDCSRKGNRELHGELNSAVVDAVESSVTFELDLN
ncbi:MAG: 2-succinyl-5-enolpyruvyl-6-hydroxy-3-cyclohexene-1-carboxylic-acid synthase [Microthrixaceae bacterium]|nr:2-succinyl-5-enolpyruvyl-6-hydroxy-3-cyclohexene-1-carboxylic-acid synthase [Microthrixaceae bacterium]